jgi:hypothetical protein
MLKTAATKAQGATINSGSRVFRIAHLRAFIERGSKLVESKYGLAAT